MDVDMAIRVVATCVAAAMICSILRVQRPEMAMALSLATGVAVLAALVQGIQTMTPEAQPLLRLFRQADSEATGVVLRAVGISIVAELGVQLCADAGETALAGRIALAARVAVLCLCLPIAGRIAEQLGAMLS